jgi:thiol-disulfide isomerase/thioredoxin
MSEQKQILRKKQKNSQNLQSVLLVVLGLGLVIVAAVVAFSLPRAQAEVQQSQKSGGFAIPLEVNFPAPEVKISDLKGNPVALSDYKGQIVLYNAWATWCPPCKDEMPTLDAYYKDHRAEGFVVVAIEDGEPVEQVAEYVRANGLSFPVWPDLKWVATTSFKTDILPSSFVIDRTGVVRLTWTGPITRESLEKFVTPLIKQ